MRTARTSLMRTTVNSLSLRTTTTGRKYEFISCLLKLLISLNTRKVPPFTIDAGTKVLVPVKVKVSTSLMNILAISEFDHTINLKLGITLKWYENRVLYHNLKMKEALNTLTDAEVGTFTQSFVIFLFRLTCSGSPT